MSEALVSIRLLEPPSSSRSIIGALGMVLLAAVACRSEPASAPAQQSAMSEAFDLDFARTPEAASASPKVAVTADGSRFAVAASSRPSSILIFDGTGSFVKAVGREGMGPGELGRISTLVFDSTDSLWVFGPGRVDIWSPDFQPVRSIPLRIPVSDAAMSSDGAGAFVVGSSLDPATARVRARFLTRQGELSPLEQESGPYIAGEAGSENRSIVATPRGYWIANFHEWDIRHLDLDGDTLARIAEAPAWWRPFEDEEMAGYIDTSPAILDVGIDVRGDLWVLSGIPIPDREALDAVKNGDQSLQVRTAFADHMLTVFNGSTLDLIFEQRFEYLPLTFVSPDLAVAAVPAGDSINVVVHPLETLRRVGTR